jgi:hypothetical protein
MTCNFLLSTRWAHVCLIYTGSLEEEMPVFTVIMAQLKIYLAIQGKVKETLDLETSTLVLCGVRISADQIMQTK